MQDFSEMLEKNKTMICAILNITPDSFSDGNQFANLEEVINKANLLAEQGADILDIGAESTRPHSTLLNAEQEIARLSPVLQALQGQYPLPISVDTWKAEVAEYCLKHGATIINDITGLMGDEQMAQLIAEKQSNVIIMFNTAIARPDHALSKGFPVFQVDWENPNHNFNSAEYAKLAEASILDIAKYYLEKAIEKALKAGVKENRIMIDPGFGFAQSFSEMIILLKNLADFKAFGFPVLLGISRKRVIAGVLEQNGIKADLKSAEGMRNRDLATAMLSFYASQLNIDAVRTHTVSEHLIATAFADALKD